MPEGLQKSWCSSCNEFHCIRHHSETSDEVKKVCQSSSSAAAAEQIIEAPKFVVEHAEEAYSYVFNFLVVG